MNQKGHWCVAYESKQIRQLAEDMNCRFNHTFRVNNKAVDFIANHGVSLQDKNILVV